MKSAMIHSFAQTPTIDAPRSKFDRSFPHKFTGDSGWLIPFMWDPVLPGDTYDVETYVMARMSTPLFPLMDNMVADVQYWNIPTRLLWANFRKFCGEQTDPGDSIAYSIPILSGTRNSDCDGDLTTAAGRTGVLLDYMGVPDGIDATDVDISALPFLAYNFCFNEWYRDQNLIDSVYMDTGDAAKPDTNFELLRRGKRHDYFTSCLPWPQKGDAVTLPLGTSAPVVTNDAQPLAHGQTTTADRLLTVDGTSADELKLSGFAGGSENFRWGAESGLEADLTNATAATINDIREAFQTQKLLERDARAGTRYSEIVSNHFNVNFTDLTYRPEYLGGGSISINVNPVSSTAADTVKSLEVGDQGAFATISGKFNGFTKSFNEHGIILGIISVRADLTYQQGLSRHFSHSTRYDYYWPSLAMLGEQAVLNKEIYCDGTANDDLAFGYQERYAEYRYKPAQISGLFKSAAAASLDSWHLSQEFASLPTLGQTFIEENPPVDRVVVTSTEPQFIFDTYTKMICARPMPVVGVPGMIDHF